MAERTFAIIKPDAVAAGNADKIMDMIKDNGFTIVEKLTITMPLEDAKKLYDIHKERPFFGEMLEFITSGPVVIMALEKDNAIKAWRDLMGATNPADAAQGTVRKLFGIDIGTNAAHGSDSADNAKAEL
ncbi:nucleoside-diphosphate kinase, partial [Candidatus Dependentiae bacterium]|nr:nucleoside-diphosphate kinase [Candidatus Dependentiae bacterium]